MLFKKLLHVIPDSQIIRITELGEDVTTIYEVNASDLAELDEATALLDYEVSGVYTLRGEESVLHVDLLK